MTKAKTSTQRSVVQFAPVIFGQPMPTRYTRVVEWDYDPFDGADADGRRGVPRWSFSEESPEAITVSLDPEGDGDETPIAVLPEDTRKAVLVAIDERNRATSPEKDGGPEEEPDEPDYNPEEELERELEREEREREEMRCEEW